MVEQNSKVMEYYKHHLSIAKAMGDRTEEGRAYRNLGIISRRLGDFKQAIEYHRQELCIAKEVGDKAREGAAYGNLGNAYHSVGEFNQAIWHHKQDLSISKEFKDRVGEGAAYGNLGNAYHRLGDFKQAIDYHKQRLTIMKEVGNKAGEGAAYGDLGNAYRRLGELKQAVEYHKQNLLIAKEVGDKAGEGAAYGNLGNAHDSLGQFQEAIEYHRQHLSIAKEIEDRAGEGRAFCNLGNVYHALGDFEQAIAYHKEDLAVSKEVGDKAEEGEACGNLGNAFDGLGEHEKAIEYHKQHLSIAKEVGDRAGQALACYSLGFSFESLGSLRKAIDYYGCSVKLYNDMRALLHTEDEWKIRFRSYHQNVYTALWTTLLRTESTDEALCAAEQGRAQALMDLLKLQYGFQESLSGSCEPNEAVSYILSDVSTKTVFVALGSDTINFWILCKGNGIQFRQKKIDNIRTGVDATTLLQNVMKTAFQANGVGVAVKCENRSLDELRGDEGLPLNNDSDQEISHSTLPCKTKSLRLLYDITVGPIADLLQGDDAIIVPDGPLCLAPFAAFLDSDSRYLNDFIRIRIIPSLTSLKLIEASPKDYHVQNGALIVGDPCVEEITNKRGKPILPQLSYARVEAKMIGAILKTPPLTGKEATKGEVLKQITSVALVHIAAHGDAKTGEIALAPNPGWTSRIPKEEDYILKVADVQAVQLRAKLVVLSCCHSGRGTVTADGVVGIARAFLGAGARSVLVSLWAIDDEATMEFMRSFYENLGRGYSAGLALNQAMKSLRETEKFNAVKYWAPFVLIGDDVKLHFGQKE
ncbi:hypothetical protein ACROYT_G041585 [Oculina patagonica]